MLVKLLTLAILLPFGFLVSGVVQEFGFQHALGAFSVGAFFCVLFIALDNWSGSSASKLQWAALSVNVLLLSYTFMLLPTNEAIEVLEKSGVNQNFWEMLKSWWEST